jgi:hypothetical protein
MARMMPGIELLGQNSQIRKSQIGPRPRALDLMPAHIQPAPKHETASDFREVEGDHVWLELCQQSNCLVKIRKFKSLKLALDLMPDRFSASPKARDSFRISRS